VAAVFDDDVALDGDVAADGERGAPGDVDGAVEPGAVGDGEIDGAAAGEVDVAVAVQGGDVDVEAAVGGGGVEGGDLGAGGHEFADVDVLHAAAAVGEGARGAALEEHGGDDHGVAGGAGDLHEHGAAAENERAAVKGGRGAAAGGAELVAVGVKRIRGADTGRVDAAAGGLGPPVGEGVPVVGVAVVGLEIPVGGRGGGEQAGEGGQGERYPLSVSYHGVHGSEGLVGFGLSGPTGSEGRVAGDANGRVRPMTNGRRAQRRGCRSRFAHGGTGVRFTGV